MGLLSRIATALFIVALPVLLVTTNIRVLLSEVRFYERGFRAHDSDIATGIDLAQLDRAAGEIVDYFFNDAEELRIIVVENGQEVSLFNEREIRHMADVKDLVTLTLRAQELALVYVIGYVALVVIWRRERTLRDLARRALAGVGLGAAIVLAVGALALTGFDRVWNNFHEIVFSNDFWQLDSSRDHLIQMFPEAFWEEAVFIVVLLSIAEATVIVVAATAYLFLTRDTGRRLAAGPEPAPREAADPDDLKAEAPPPEAPPGARSRTVP